MKSVGGYVTLVVLLVVAGAVAWFAGKSEERLAAAEYSLVTLRYDRELRSAGIDYVQIDTSQPLDFALLAYLSARARRK